MEITKLYLSQRLDPQHKKFFQNTLEKFASELEIVSNEFYDSKEADVFMLIEKAFVGIWSKSIVKLYPESAFTIEEFAVWNSGKLIGRADLLVKKYIEGTPVCFLFEAKQREFTGREYSNSQLGSFYSELEQQAFKYFDAEREFYKEEVFLVPLIFEWIRNRERLEKVLSWKDDEDDGLTDFYCVVHSDRNEKDASGLMVYGRVLKQN